MCRALRGSKVLRVSERDDMRVSDLIRYVITGLRVAQPMPDLYVFVLVLHVVHVSLCTGTAHCIYMTLYRSCTLYSRAHASTGLRVAQPCASTKHRIARV